MASPTSKPLGKRPVNEDDDADIDELDGANSNNCALRHRVIHRTRTLNRYTRRLYPETSRETRTSNNSYRSSNNGCFPIAGYFYPITGHPRHEVCG
jgi:hypothetical protein